MKRYVIKRKDGLYWNRERGTWWDKLSSATKFPVSKKKLAAFKKSCSLCGHKAVAVRKKQRFEAQPIDPNVRWVIKNIYLNMYYSDTDGMLFEKRTHATRYEYQNDARQACKLLRMPSFDPESIKVFRVTQKRSRS